MQLKKESIWSFPYQLESKVSLNRFKQKGNVFSGSLLMVENSQVGLGYSCVHPWENLGDLPLKKQLQLIQEGKLTELTQASYDLACADALARKEERSLFQNLTIPESHLTISDWSLLDEDILDKLFPGFLAIKIKSKGNVEDEKKILEKICPYLKSKSIQLRLDYNSYFKDFKKAFEYFDSMTDLLKSCIEYIEDPLVYQKKSWEELSKALSLAQDREPSSKYGKVLPMVKYFIYKPAISSIKKVKRPFVGKNLKQVIVTSYMDHPVGQYGAAYSAAILKKKYTQGVGLCGLLTHDLFKKNDFSERMKKIGAQLFPQEEVGIGFGDLLSKLSWKKLL